MLQPYSNQNKSPHSLWSAAICFFRGEPLARHEFYVSIRRGDGEARGQPHRGGGASHSSAPERRELTTEELKRLLEAARKADRRSLTSGEGVASTFGEWHTLFLIGIYTGGTTSGQQQGGRGTEATPSGRDNKRTTTRGGAAGAARWGRESTAMTRMWIMRFATRQIALPRQPRVGQFCRGHNRTLRRYDALRHELLQSMHCWTCHASICVLSRNVLGVITAGQTYPSAVTIDRVFGNV